MYAFTILIIISSLSDCVIVNRKHEKKVIKADTRIELQPIEIETGLNKIIKLTPPVLGLPEVIFLELIKPDGETFSLNDNITSSYNIPLVKYLKSAKYIDENSITTKLRKLVKSYHEIDLNKNSVFDGLVIGPLLEEDHGNWVLSAYLKDTDDRFVEMFQVITLMITEYVQNTQKEAKRRVAEDFHLSFAYPIPDLETCQLVSPQVSKDVVYHRDENTKNTCGFTVKNLTENDEGTWEIIGVGKIVYKGNTFLKVLNQRHLKT